MKEFEYLSGISCTYSHIVLVSTHERNSSFDYYFYRFYCDKVERNYENTMLVSSCKTWHLCECICVSAYVSLLKWQVSYFGNLVIEDRSFS